MKIGDILQRDPAIYALPNDGQARITEGATEKEIRQLRDELSTFICKGQFKDGMATILSSYVASLGQSESTTQRYQYIVLWWRWPMCEFSIRMS